MQYLNTWYYILKRLNIYNYNIELDIYLGVSNISLRDKFSTPLKEFYLKFTKTLNELIKNDIFYKI